MKNLLYFALLVVFAPIVCQAQQPRQTAMDYFKKLPVEAFDNTTDGLDEAEKALLISAGQSPGWILEKKSDDQVLVKCKVPFSEVTLTVKRGATEALEVKTQNQQALTVETWKADPAKPGTLVKQGTPEPVAKVEEAVAPEVKAFVEKRDRCEHWMGEEAYDEERGKFLAQKFKEDCTGTDAELKRLREKYKANPKSVEALSRYEEIVE